MFLCCTKDEEGQCLGTICFGRQCGVAPAMCCDKDDDGINVNLLFLSIHIYIFIINILILI
jgi:hypothetical protein